MRRLPHKRGNSGTRTAARGAMLLALFPAVYAFAQEPQDHTPLAADQIQKAIESRREELDSTKEKERALQDDVARLNQEREKINARLVETAALIQKSEAQMTAIEARLGELESQEKLVRGSLQQRHGQIAKLLAALQRMGRNPPPVMITRREDALGMVRSAMLLAAAFPEMRSQALELTEKLDELTRVMSDIRKEGDKLKTETMRLNDMRTRLAGLMATKKQSLAERQAELGQVRVAAAEISKNVNDLSELITKLDEAVTSNTGLGAYQEESKAAATATDTSSQPTAPSPANSPPGKPTEVALLPPQTAPDPSVVELAPSSTSLVPGDPGRIKPAISFNLAKAKLPMPVQGRRVLSYGEKTQFGGNSKGIVVETRANAQVTSPCDGWVVYAGEFRSYGQLLIINAGGGYHVLVAGLSQIDVQPGQFVLAAEPVGTMSGASAPAPGGAATSAPVLYVEFRKDGQPIDPDPWWVADTQKVQG